MSRFRRNSCETVSNTHCAYGQARYSLPCCLERRRKVYNFRYTPDFPESLGWYAVYERRADQGAFGRPSRCADGSLEEVTNTFCRGGVLPGGADDAFASVFLSLDWRSDRP